MSSSPHRCCPVCGSKAFAATGAYEHCKGCDYRIDFAFPPHLPLMTEGEEVAADDQTPDPRYEDGPDPDFQV